MITASLQIVMLVALVSLAYIDFKERRVPNIALLGLLFTRIGIFIVQAVLFLAFGGSTYDIFGDPMLASLAFGGLFLLLNLITHKNFGMGDVKLAALIGLYLGLQKTLLTVVIAMLLAALISLALLAMKKKAKTDDIPLVPFFAVGAFISIITLI